jgi:hypothetical protein
MPRMKEKALTAELAKRGFESISVKREHPDGRVEVEANKLHPVPVEGETIYAPVPVSFSVALDAGGRVKSIEGGDPSFADAGRYIKTLRDSGQLAVAGDRQAASRPTHQIERDAQGRDVLRRKRFWIS